MSQKTSTAALDSFGEGRVPNRRRAPRHPASGRRGSKEATKQGSNEKAKEAAKESGQARILVCQGGDMSEAKANRPAGKPRLLLPVILRITVSLALWTLGAAPMILTEAQTGKDRSAKCPQSKRATSSTKQTKHRSLVLTRRAALTKPLGTPEEEMK